MLLKSKRQADVPTTDVEEATVAVSESTYTSTSPDTTSCKDVCEADQALYTRHVRGGAEGQESWLVRCTQRR